MMQHIQHHAEQQQQPPSTEPNNYSENNDYLQILDAGEHMYKMFVAEDEDLYAYLRNNDECFFEDAISHEDLQMIDGLDRCCDNYYCDASARIYTDQAHNKNFKNTENSNNCTSDDERSATAGRMSPTQTEEHHDDAIIE
jgi:hypothetical protein